MPDTWYVPQASGGGTQGPPGPAGPGAQTSPAPGRFLAAWPTGQATTLTVGVGNMMASRVVLGVAIQSVCFDVATLGASATFKLGIYDDSAYPFPGNLVQSSLDMSAGTTGTKTWALSLAAGTYWIAILNSGPTSFVTRSSTTQNPYAPGALVSPAYAAFLPSAYTFPSGQPPTLPSPWPAGASDSASVNFFVQAA